MTHDIVQTTRVTIIITIKDIEIDMAMTTMGDGGDDDLILSIERKKSKLYKSV